MLAQIIGLRSVDVFGGMSATGLLTNHGDATSQSIEKDAHCRIEMRRRIFAADDQEAGPEHIVEPPFNPGVAN
ncbi:unnamed protein product, partial [marine sediment metagenome]